MKEIVSLVCSPTVKPLVGHGSGLQTDRLLTVLAGLDCGSSANLSNALNSEMT